MDAGDGAFAFAASRGEVLTIWHPLGLLLPLALLAGFVGLYQREQRLHPEMEDEDDRRFILGRVVIKLGCLLVATASISAAIFALLLGR
jgi:hypothetical protein